MSELIDKALADCGDTDVVVMGRNVLEETGREHAETDLTGPGITKSLGNRDAGT